MSKCKICNNSEASNTYVAREMMFGYGDEFEYFECSECGCVQIKEFPNNLTKYYSPDYMSFCKPNVPKLFFPISFIKQRRLRYSLGEKDLYGNLFYKIFGIGVTNCCGYFSSSQIHFIIRTSMEILKGDYTWTKTSMFLSSPTESRNLFALLKNTRTRS